MGGTGSKRRWTTTGAILLAATLAGCGGGDGAAGDATDANSSLSPSGAMLPADVISQETSNLASEPAPPLPDIVWSVEMGGDRDALHLTEGDGSRSLTLMCGGRPARLMALVPGFAPSRIGEPMRLAIGATEIALSAGNAPVGIAGSLGEGVIPSNLGDLLAAAPAIDIVQGAQRLGSTPPPPRARGAEFAAACAARAG